MLVFLIEKIVGLKSEFFKIILNFLNIKCNVSFYFINFILIYIFYFSWFVSFVYVILVDEQNYTR